MFPTWNYFAKSDIVITLAFHPFELFRRGKIKRLMSKEARYKNLGEIFLVFISFYSFAGLLAGIRFDTLFFPREKQP